VFEIGNTLREARVRRSLTLQQVEEDTKIRVKYIQAMENEDFDVMPGATYVRGFLRTYSVYLGLDADVIVGEYRSRGSWGTDQPEPFGGTSMLGGPRSRRGRNTVLFVAVVCLLMLGVIYALSLGDGLDEGPATQPVPLGIASSTPSPSPSPTPTRTKPPVVPGELRVSASYAEAWLEVREESGTGKVLYSGLLEEGKAKVFTAEKLWLRLGSPSSVRLRVEGRTLKKIDEAGPIDYIIEGGKLKKQG
jgi:hypothetical protein